MADRPGARLFARSDLLTVRPAVGEGLTCRSGFLTGRPESGC